MALTPAEKQKAYRKRKKAEATKNEKIDLDIAAKLYRKPFSEWAETDANIGECDMYMALAGMEFPGFYDERDAEDFVIDRPAFGEAKLFGTDLSKDELLENAEGALRRAEIMIDCMLDTVMTLASSLNDYKRHEIEARIKELEQSNDIDRATAMKQAVRLNKILNQFNKQVRRSFPQWKVTGT